MICLISNFSNERIGQQHYIQAALNLHPHYELVKKIIFQNPGSMRLIPDGVTGIFHRHNPSGRTMTLELTQPLT
jgi:hypothetical protein